MTAVLCIIPLITRLLANTKKKKTSHSVAFYNLFVTINGVFQQRNIVRQTDFAPPSSQLSTLFLFLTNDDNSACFQDSESLYFPKMLKLKWALSILVAWEYVFFHCEVDYRYHLATKYAGVTSDPTTFTTTIQEHGVVWNMWIRGKKATFMGKYA